MTVLGSIASPDDVKSLPAADLTRLAAEIRDHLVTSVSRTGGHLGPNLGVVELTIALHRVFSSPRDAIVWDTGGLLDRSRNAVLDAPVLAALLEGAK